MFLDKLTKTEKKVLMMLMSGSTTKEVAAALFVSENTIKKQRSMIMDKLAAKNMVHAVYNYMTHYGCL